MKTNTEYSIKHLPLKRTFDIFFSIFCLIILSPIFLVISILILFTSSGNIIYSHERMGRGGKPFRCYKFRTMYLDADIRLAELLKHDPQLLKEWQQTYKLKKDPRVTAIGNVLRKLSLDELPQFWNVLRGDLSVVGPRPVVKEEFEKYFGTKGYKILSIRPGLTGLWQVSGRSDITCYHKRIQLDEYYVDNQSLLFDLQLILKTIPVMLGQKGAY
ncbi:MAG: sugar transferase [Parachlamydiaceae bacterium]|nr:sugar transferase [Parachlamydiaceae bacterium]